MNSALVLILLLVASTKACFFNECISGYDWSGKNESKEQNNTVGKRSSGILVNLENEFQQCFGDLKIGKELCKLIDLRTCCRIGKDQKLICDELSANKLVCEPVRQKLAQVLEKMMNENEIATDDVRCCIDAVHCCENDECEAQLICSLSEEKSRKYSNDVSREQNLLSLLLKSIKKEEEPEFSD